MSSPSHGARAAGARRRPYPTTVQFELTRQRRVGVAVVVVQDEQPETVLAVLLPELAAQGYHGDVQLLPWN